MAKDKDKEAYYFSHDSNARNDPKIGAMRVIYGSEGYGWYWMLVEMMREQTGYKLNMQSKYAFRAMAMQLQCNADAAENFVQDCINEFQLFETDGVYFWSRSLLRRMEKKEEKSEKYSKNARKRWEKSDTDATAMQSLSNGNALKESKVKEIKEKESKEKQQEDVVVVNPFKLFESEGFGTISSVVADKLGFLIDEYSERWVCEAMKASVVQGLRRLSYVEGTLKNWKANGIDEPWNQVKPVKGGKQGGSKSNSRDAPDDSGPDPDELFVRR